MEAKLIGALTHDTLRELPLCQGDGAISSVLDCVSYTLTCTIDSLSLFVNSGGSKSRRGGGEGGLVLLAFSPSVISSFFTQNRGGKPLGPLP